MTARAQTGPRHEWLGRAVYRAGLPMLQAMFARHRFYRQTSAYATARLSAIREKLRRGETVYLLGIGPAGHNSGAALLEVARGQGPRIVCNNEEERFTGKKHCTDFPALGLASVREEMERLGVPPERIDACLASWDYAALSAILLRTVMEESPASWRMLRPGVFPGMNIEHLFRASRAAYALGRALGIRGAQPIIGMPHHENHACFSFGVSPFAGSAEPVMISVLDGFGDHGAISFYVAEGGGIRRVYSNGSIFDSLGVFYSFISSTQGGWTILSSEGRYMGAAAWGDADRLTNPYYAALRQIFYFHEDGTVSLNRSLANWPRKLFDEPYTEALRRILGAPIPLREMWNPDSVLRVEDIRHKENTQERLDKAAATQMVFEDVLFHVIGRLIRATGSHQLVLTGGTALNGLANMRLLEHFDEGFYERNLGRKDTRLHIWAPPVPGDAGVTLGAAYQFAIRAGAEWGPALEHAFYCGRAATAGEIRAALDGCAEIGWIDLGDAGEPGWMAAVADLLAYITSMDGVAALFQGPAETGPRALGHRSILANPRNPQTREVLNRLVKYREGVRPLAPMATLEAALRWFELSPGASDSEYNAYHYMVLTARARPESYAWIPAAIHRDGTVRVQIVRRRHNPFTHAYLKALGRRIGVEVAVNTSFNVAGPIVQTPRQALETLKRSKGMDAVFFLSADGPAYAAWHNIVSPPKDGGRRLRQWIEEWRAETGVSGLRLHA